MSERVVELYSPQRLEQLKKRRKTVKRLLWVLGLAALAVCVVLTALANSHNLYRMLLACICGAASELLFFSASVRSS